MDFTSVHPFHFLKLLIMNTQFRKILFTVLLLALAGISPNLFPAAQAGIATFPLLVKQWLFPSAALILMLIFALKLLQYQDLSRIAIKGIVAGLVATIVLEIFSITGFKLGWMPGDLPRLMGVILLNRFASGPDVWSDIAGWAYHFWNGAMFGLIFSLIFGQSKLWQGLLYGLLIGLGFMLSPVVKSLGIGTFGVDFKDGYQFAITVTVAHLGFGVALSFLLKYLNKAVPNIWIRSKGQGAEIRRISVRKEFIEA